MRALLRGAHNFGEEASLPLRGSFKRLPKRLIVIVAVGLVLAGAGAIVILTLPPTGREASSSKFHVNFKSEVYLPAPVGNCSAQGEGWGEDNMSRLVYSGVGSSSCWEDTNGNTVELVADGHQFWTYNRQTGQSSTFPSEVQPEINKDYSSLLSNTAPWCAAEYYRCRVIDKSLLFGRSSVAVEVTPLVKAPVDPLVPNVFGGISDYWVDEVTHRILRRLEFDTAGNLISRFEIEEYQSLQELPTAVFDHSSMSP